MEFNLPVRILAAVGLLHRDGFGSLRIYPGMNASGTAWRIALHDDAASDKAECIIYSSAAKNNFMGAEVEADSDVPHVAKMILAGLPSLRASTSHSDYVSWFAGLLDQVRSMEDLPVAYADYFDVSNGWEVGWCSRRYYPEPPKR